MFYNKNNVFVGLLIGLAFPIVAYALVLTFLEALDSIMGFSQVRLSTALKPRTLALIAICINIFVMQYYRRLRADESMRGVFIAVGIAALLWIIKYSGEIFGNL
ncbi:MAG: hypothetical protein ACOYOA_06280 [Saprospiraceae bacterium]